MSQQPKPPPPRQQPDEAMANPTHSKPDSKRCRMSSGSSMTGERMIRQTSTLSDLQSNVLKSTRSAAAKPTTLPPQQQLKPTPPQRQQPKPQQQPKSTPPQQQLLKCTPPQQHSQFTRSTVAKPNSATIHTVRNTSM